MVLAALVVAVAGNRPLLPLPVLWEKLHAKFPDNELVADQARAICGIRLSGGPGPENFPG